MYFKGRVLDAMSNCATPVYAIQHALDNTAPKQELSEVPAPQTVEVDGQNDDKSATLMYRHYITGKIRAPLAISCL